MTTVKPIQQAEPQQSGLTEGEYFISKYFDEAGIKYESQVKIEKLNADDKAYRIADFYLPDYKMYVEYLGQWNKHEEAKGRYREKKFIYNLNNIPCVYLYPENLGILDFLFDARIKVELQRHKLNRELFKYRRDRLIEDRGDLFFWLMLCIVMLSLGDYHSDPSTNFQYVGFLSSVLLFQLFRLYRGLKKHFLLDKKLNLNIKNN